MAEVDDSKYSNSYDLNSTKSAVLVPDKVSTSESSLNGNNNSSLKNNGSAEMNSGSTAVTNKMLNDEPDEGLVTSIGKGMKKIWEDDIVDAMGGGTVRLYREYMGNVYQKQKDAEKLINYGQKVYAEGGAINNIKGFLLEQSGCVLRDFAYPLESLDALGQLSEFELGSIGKGISKGANLPYKIAKMAGQSEEAVIYSRTLVPETKAVKKIETAAVEASKGTNAVAKIETVTTTASKTPIVLGEPVSVATGEYLENWHDFFIQDIMPLDGSRYMGLKMPMSWKGPLGFCQLSMFDEIITNPCPGYLSYFDSDGHEITFQRPFNFLASTNSAFPHLELKAPWLKNLILKNKRIIKKFKQYPDNIYRLEIIEDLNGNRLNLLRDNIGVLYSVETQDGLKLQFENNNEHLRTKITLVGVDGKRKILTNYCYDKKGRMISSDCQFGMSVKYYWHETQNLILQWHNKTQRSKTIFTYDDDGSVIHTETTGLWNGDTFEYDKENRQTIYSPAGNKSRNQTFIYDENKNVTAEIDALEGVTRHIFNKAGFKEYTKNAYGNITQYKYDIFGNVTQTIDAENRKEVFGWGSNGELDIEIDPLGNVTKYENDEFGLLISTKDAENNETRYERNIRGQIIRQIYVDGTEQKFAYNEHGWLSQSIDIQGGVTSYTYDAFGRVISSVNALGHKTQYEYNANAGGFDTPTKLIRPDGVIITRDFDEEGTLSHITDGEGRKWIYRYGAFDVLQEIEDPQGGKLKFEYDSNGNLINVINALGCVYHLRRDAAERVIEEEDFDGRITCYKRDIGGRVIETIKPDGSRLVYSYDKTDLLTHIQAYAAKNKAKDEPNEIVTLAYDKCGQLERAENNSAIVKFKRDKIGRIIEQQTNGRRIKSTYDAMGRRIKRSVFSRKDTDSEHAFIHGVNYMYNKHGILDNLHIGSHKPLEFKYDALGREIRRESSKGFYQEQHYDTIGQLIEQIAGLSVKSYGKGLEGLRNIQQAGLEKVSLTPLKKLWKWDKSSSPIQIDDTLWGNVTYRYNQNGQVQETEFNKNKSEKFNYDAACNIRGIQESLGGSSKKIETFFNWKSTPGGVIQLAKGANKETVYLKHDECGRVVERAVEKKGFRRKLWRYEWDVFDRLIACLAPDGEKWTYGYDAFGRRIYKIQSSAAKAAVRKQQYFLSKEEKNRGAYYEEKYSQSFHNKDDKIIVGTSYLWDGDVMAEEADMLGDGSSDWGRSTKWHYEINSFSPLAKETAQGELFYIVNDHLGTPQEMFSESGELIWSIRLSTWGNVRGVHTAQLFPANDDFTFHDSSQPSGGKIRGNTALKPALPDAAYDCPIRFQGQWQDAETGLYYNRFRYYDPLTAQYTSPDPIGLKGGARPQGYVVNPIIFFDFFGLTAIKKDNGGRTTEWLTTIGPENIGTGTKTNAAVRKFARMIGKVNDDAGHALGANLGGSGTNIENIFPQSISINRGQFAQFERQIAIKVKQTGQQATLKLVAKYMGPSLRPNALDYLVTFQDGSVIHKVFGN